MAGGFGRPARAAVLRRHGDGPQGRDPGLELPDRWELEEWPALKKALDEAFRTKTQAEWTALFDGTDSCVAPVVPIDEAAQHPHNVARGTYIEHEGLVQPAPAPRFSETPANLTTAPVAAGTNTAEALAAWGITDIDSLLADGVAVQAD